MAALDDLLWLTIPEPFFQKDHETSCDHFGISRLLSRALLAIQQESYFKSSSRTHKKEVGMVVYEERTWWGKPPIRLFRTAVTVAS